MGHGNFTNPGTEWDYMHFYPERTPCNMSEDEKPGPKCFCVFGSQPGFSSSNCSLSILLLRSREETVMSVIPWTSQDDHTIIIIARGMCYHFGASTICAQFHCPQIPCPIPMPSGARINSKDLDSTRTSCPYIDARPMGITSELIHITNVTYYVYCSFNKNNSFSL